MDSITLWHGTTRSAAERIVEEGFRRVNTAEIVRHTARQHKVDDEAVVDLLHRRGRFLVIQEGREDSVWFATSRLAAVRWAQRAPEARWEALWSIWCIREHRLEEWSPWADPAAAAWHLRQFLADLPAVVEARVPVDQLWNGLQKRAKVDRDGWLGLVAEGMVPEVRIGLPSADHWVVGFSDVQRRVGFVAAAGLMDKTIDELTEMVRRGDIASCREPDNAGGERYWHLEELVRYQVL